VSEPARAGILAPMTVPRRVVIMVDDTGKKPPVRLPTERDGIQQQWASLLALLHAAWWLLDRHETQPALPARSLDYRSPNTKKWIESVFGDWGRHNVFRTDHGGAIRIHDANIAGVVVFSVEGANGVRIQPEVWSELVDRQIDDMGRQGTELDEQPAKFLKINKKLISMMRGSDFRKLTVDRNGISASPVPKPQLPADAPSSSPPPDAPEAPVEPPPADRGTDVRPSAETLTPASVSKSPRAGHRWRHLILGAAVGVAAAAAAGAAAGVFALDSSGSAGAPIPGASAASSAAQPRPVYRLYAHPNQVPRTAYAKLGAALQDELRRGGVTLELGGSEATTNARELSGDPNGLALVEATTPLRGFPLPLAQPYVERLQIAYECNERIHASVRDLDAVEDRARSGWRCPPLILGACGPRKPCSNEPARALVQQAFAEDLFTAGDSKKSAHMYIPALARALGLPLPRAWGPGLAAYGRGIAFEEALQNFGKPGSTVRLAFFVSGMSQALLNARDKSGVIGFDELTFEAVRRESRPEWGAQLRFAKLGYPGMQNVGTLGVPAVLVAGDRVPRNVRYRMMSALCSLRGSEEVAPLLRELKLYRGPLVEDAETGCPLLDAMPDD
jgi:hypothetical protein